MTADQDTRVETFDQLNSFLDKYDRFEGWVYRGHANASWPLLPKLSRTTAVSEMFTILHELERLQSHVASLAEKAEHARSLLPERQPTTTEYPLQEANEVVEDAREALRTELVKSEAISLHYWQRYAVRYLSQPPTNDWQWLAIGQHFGLATRLLDWTDNPLAAAFFALFESEPRTDAAIYALKCEGLVKEQVSLSSLDSVYLYRPPPMIDRIVLQSALFSVMPSPFGPLRSGGKVSVVKAVIPLDARQLLLRKVVSFGVDNSMLFPDLGGAALHVNFSTENAELLHLRITDRLKRLALRRESIQAKTKAALALGLSG